MNNGNTKLLVGKRCEVKGVDGKIKHCVIAATSFYNGGALKLHLVTDKGETLEKAFTQVEFYPVSYTELQANT